MRSTEKHVDVKVKKPVIKMKSVEVKEVKKVVIKMKSTDSAKESKKEVKRGDSEN
jgi:hypothetical protein